MRSGAAHETTRLHRLGRHGRASSHSRGSPCSLADELERKSARARSGARGVPGQRTATGHLRAGLHPEGLPRPGHADAQPARTSCRCHVPRYALQDQVPGLRE